MERVRVDLDLGSVPLDAPGDDLIDLVEALDLASDTECTDYLDHRACRGSFAVRALVGPAPAIFQTFPDFLIQYDVGQLFYFVSFAAGWWLHRQRAALPSLAEGWLTNAVVGLTAYGVAVGLQARYGGGADSPCPSGKTCKVVSRRRAGTLASGR